MGTLRFVLAMSVAGWHISDKLAVIVSGYLAVTCFYIISGFYMSMVIVDTYKGRDHWISRFYISRFLRLYPLYWVIAIATVIFSLATYQSAANLFNFDLVMSPLTRVGVLTANTFILGLDAIVMCVREHKIDATVLRLVAPAWSLSIEIQFYLLAPFILTRSIRFLFAVLAVMIAVRLALLGWPYDPWRYYFSPSVGCFFILGALSHRLSAMIKDDVLKKWLGVFAIGTLPALSYLTGTAQIKDIDRPELWVFYIAFAAFVPFLFELTKNNRLDTAIGNLSYPIYLVHRFIFFIIAVIVGAEVDTLNVGWWFAALLAVVIVSLVLHYAIETPVENLRAQLKGRALRRPELPDRSAALP